MAGAVGVAAKPAADPQSYEAGQRQGDDGDVEGGGLHLDTSGGGDGYQYNNDGGGGEEAGQEGGAGSGKRTRDGSESSDEDADADAAAASKRVHSEAEPSVEEEAEPEASGCPYCSQLAKLGKKKVNATLSAVALSPLSLAWGWL